MLEQVNMDYFGEYSRPITNEPAKPALAETRPQINAEGGSTLTQRIHAKLIDLVTPERLNRLPEENRRGEVRRAVQSILDAETTPVPAAVAHQIQEDVLDEVFGFGPLEKLLREPGICDILVNGPRQVYVERRGVLEESPVHFRNDDHLLQIIQRIVSRVGRRVDESSPMVDARLPDGSRVNAIIPPLSLRGPTLSIRRFGQVPLRLDEMLRRKALTSEMALYLDAAVKSRLNVLVCGGTGSGKTTLLNVLSALIPHNERIISVEDSAELQLQQRHVVQLETRPPNIEGKGEVTSRQLVRNCLRMRPNRIIVGECRGAEAVDMLQAMNTGHPGSMTTLHANTPRDALTRLEMMLRMAGMRVPMRALRTQIAAAINVLIQVDRLPGGDRRIVSITEVVGMERSTITTQELFAFRQEAVDATGRAVGHFEASGVATHFHDRFRAAGFNLPGDLFRPRPLAWVA